MCYVRRRAAVGRDPPRFHVSQIGGDFLLGTVRDTLNVERIVLLKLIKP
ncbi:MAG: hypothetical protein ACRENP_20340 [Longimicrobiales bacterium]